MNEQYLSKIFTPSHHILIGEAYSKAGVIYLRIKKSGKNIVEDVPLDEVLTQIFTAVSNRSFELSTGLQ